VLSGCSRKRGTLIISMFECVNASLAMQKDEVSEQKTRQSDVLSMCESIRGKLRDQVLRIERLATRNRVSTRRADVLISLFYDLSERDLSAEETEWKAEMEKMKVGVARWSQVLGDVKGFKREKGVGGEVGGLEGVYEELVREKRKIMEVYKRFEGMNDEVARLRI
jgi:hypothetical protein